MLYYRKNLLRYKFHLYLFNNFNFLQFSVLLLLIFALELGAGITGYMMRGEVASMLEHRLNGTMRQYNINEDLRRSWDIMQHDVSSLNDLLSINIIQSYI